MMEYISGNLRQISVLFCCKNRVELNFIKIVIAHGKQRCWANRYFKFKELSNHRQSNNIIWVGTAVKIMFISLYNEVKECYDKITSLKRLIKSQSDIYTNKSVFRSMKMKVMRYGVLREILCLTAPRTSVHVSRHSQSNVNNDRTPIVGLTSIGFGNRNRTHPKILPIEYNGKFGNRTL